MCQSDDQDRAGEEREPKFTVEEMLRLFAAHLVHAFDMPAEQALARINRELAASPKTAQFNLDLRLERFKLALHWQ